MGSVHRRNRLTRCSKSLRAVAAFVVTLMAAVLIAPPVSYAADSGKPNILVIFGDDIGQANISRYTHGLMGYDDSEHRQHRRSTE